MTKQKSRMLPSLCVEEITSGIKEFSVVIDSRLVSSALGELLELQFTCGKLNSPLIQIS